MNNKKSHEEFCEEIKVLTKGEFGVNSKYTNNRSNVEFIHYECDKTFEDMPQVFVTNLKCKHCNTQINLENIFNIHNHSESVNYTTKNSNNKFKIIGEYINMDTKVEVECLECGFKDNVLPRKWLKTFFCRQCDGGIKHDIFSIIDMIYQKHGYKYVVLDERISSNTPFTILHVTCKQKMKVRLSEILNENFECKCKNNNNKCTKERNQFDTKSYGKTVNESSKGEFKLVSDFTGVDNPVTIKHIKCDQEFTITAKAFLGNMHCPHCEHNITGLIKNVKEYLESFGYKCIPEFDGFEDCINIDRPLCFDLAVCKKGKIMCVIEHDTVHHFIPIYGIDQLKYAKHLDQVKNAYCKKNKIKLIRIPFWREDDYKEILKKEFLYDKHIFDTNEFKQNLIELLDNHNIFISRDDIKLDKFIVQLTKQKSKI